MNGAKGTYIAGVLKGLQSVLIEVVKLQDGQCRNAWNNSVIKNAAEFTSCNLNEKLKDISKLDSSQVFIFYFVPPRNPFYSVLNRESLIQVEKNVTEILQRSSMVLEGLSAVLKYSPVSIREKQLPDYDLDVPNELTLYSSDVQKSGSTKSSENSTQTENSTLNLVMNEYDVVSQHESRLKIEVERHIKPSPGSLLREPVNQPPPKTTPVQTPAQFSTANPPSATPSRKTVQRPTVSQFHRANSLHVLRN